MSVPLAVAPDKVAAYIRWSTDEQSDGTTLEVQLEATRHYVASQGWTFSPDLVFVDEGYSGGTLDRPGLTRLREAIARGRVQCVVVFKLDRLSRSVPDMVQLVLREWEDRCYVKSAREPIDTGSSNGKMFFYMLASYAEWERNVIKERTMAGKVSRARQGKNPGFVHPYGYQRGPEAGSFAVAEGEAAVVRRIFREYLSGVTFREIAVQLNREGLRPRRGREWHGAVVKQIIVNPLYTGTLAYGRTTQPVPAGDLFLPAGGQQLLARADNAIPALVSVDDFLRAQEIRSSRARIVGRRAVVSDFLLTGIIRCPCGCHMEGHRQMPANYRYYRCASYRNRQEGCGSGLVPADKLEPEILRRVQAVYAPAHRAELLQEYQAELAADMRGAGERLKGAAGALEDLTRRRRRLDAAFDTGELPIKVYARRNEELDAEEVRLREEHNLAAAQLEKVRNARVDTAAIDAMVAQIDAWDALTIPQRKELFRWAIKELKVRRQKRGSGVSPTKYPIEIEISIRRPPWALDSPSVVHAEV